MKELLRIAAALRTDPAPSVLGTLVKAEGSSYRRTGARLLLRPAAPRLGSISGGCLEEDIAAHAANTGPIVEMRRIGSSGTELVLPQRAADTLDLKTLAKIDRIGDPRV